MVGNMRVQAGPEMCCPFERLSNAHGVRSRVHESVVVNLQAGIINARCGMQSAQEMHNGFSC